MSKLRVYRYHACLHDVCRLRGMEAPGEEPGHCPECGYVRRLCRIVTRRLR